jgi:hypothetical protein
MFNVTIKFNQSYNWSGVGICNHISGDIWLFIKVSIHVWPSFILSLSVYNMLVSMLSHHLLLFLLEFQLVVEEMLVVSQVLNCPCIFLGILVLSLSLVLLNLSGSLSFNLIYLFWSEILEVIRYISMWSQLWHGGSSIFSHDITHISSSNFMMVLVLLIVSPVLLSLSFFISLYLLKLL